MNRCSTGLAFNQNNDLKKYKNFRTDDEKWNTRTHTDNGYTRRAKIYFLDCIWYKNNFKIRNFVFSFLLPRHSIWELNIHDSSVKHNSILRSAINNPSNFSWMHQVLTHDTTISSHLSRRLKNTSTIFFSFSLIFHEKISNVENYFIWCIRAQFAILQFGRREGPTQSFWAAAPVGDKFL